MQLQQAIGKKVWTCNGSYNGSSGHQTVGQWAMSNVGWAMNDGQWAAGDGHAVGLP